MAHDVFISYSTKDKRAADDVCEFLEEHEIRCWMAPRDIMPGAVWSESIVAAISSSRIVLLIFSLNSNQSDHVKREIDRAIYKKIPVITIRIEDAIPSGSFELFLGATHWIDAFSLPFEAHLAKLIQNLKFLIGTKDIQNEDQENSQTAPQIANSSSEAEKFSEHNSGSPPPLMFADPAPPLGLSFDSSLMPPSENLDASMDWTPPPAPAPQWQDQGNFDSNTPFQPPGAAQGEKKGLAIASMVCGILSCLCCISIITGPAAVVMGFMARGKINSDPMNYGGGGMAMAGIITGIIGGLFGTLFLILQLIGALANARF